MMSLHLTKFQIDRKSFEVERKGEHIWIREITSNLQITQDYSNPSACWLLSRINVIRAEENLQVGFHSKRRFGICSITLRIKANGDGRFLSIHHRSRVYKRGYAVIYCPQGRHGEGWRDFAFALESLFRFQTPPRGSSIQSRRDQSFNRLHVFGGFEERVVNLRDWALILESKSVISSWEEVANQIKAIFSLREAPVVKVLSSAICIVAFPVEEDLQKVAKVGSIFASGSSIQVKKWSPGATTIPAVWARKGRHIVGLQGLPLHLWSVQVVSKLVSIFGSFDVVTEAPKGLDQIVAVWIQVNNVDLRKVPQLIDLVDLGVLFPIRVIVHWDFKGFDSDAGPASPMTSVPVSQSIPRGLADKSCTLNVPSVSETGKSFEGSLNGQVNCCNTDLSDEILAFDSFCRVPSEPANSSTEMVNIRETNRFNPIPSGCTGSLGGMEKSLGSPGMADAFNAPGILDMGASFEEHLVVQDSVSSPVQSEEIGAEFSLGMFHLVPSHAEVEGQAVVGAVLIEGDVQSSSGPGLCVGEPNLNSSGYEQEPYHVSEGIDSKTEACRVESKRLAQLWFNDVERDISALKSHLSFSGRISDLFPEVCQGEVSSKIRSFQTVGGVSMISGSHDIPKDRDESTLGWAPISDTDEGSESEVSDSDYEGDSCSDDMEENAHYRSSESLVRDFQLDVAKENEEIEAFLNVGRALGLGTESRKEDLVDLWRQSKEKSTDIKASRQGSSVSGESSPSHVF